MKHVSTHYKKIWVASKPSHADGKQVNADVSVGPQGVPCKGQQLASILTLLRIQQEFKATLKLEYKYMFAEKCASMHVHLFLLSTLKLFQKNVLRAAKPYCNLLKTFKFKVFSLTLCPSSFLELDNPVHCLCVSGVILHCVCSKKGNDSHGTILMY